MIALLLVVWVFGMVAASAPSNPYAWHRCPRDCTLYACPWLDDDEYDERWEAVFQMNERMVHRIDGWY